MPGAYDTPCSCDSLGTMPAAIVPLTQNLQQYAALVDRDLLLVDYRTSDTYERTADQSLSRAETWVTSLHVRTNPSYVAVGDLRVILWDSNSAAGNPADPAVNLPDVRTIDSQNLAPGDFFYFQPPPSWTLVRGNMQVNLGYHLEHGMRVQVIDTGTDLPIADGARIVATFITFPNVLR